MYKVIGLVIALMALSLGTINKFGKNIDEKNMSITATIPFKTDVSTLDPASIAFAHEYTILEHLYSPLVEVNADGEIVAGLASKFEWVGSDVHFTIRENFILPSGRTLTPRDVILSLKRLLILGKNSHGNISSLLCSDKQIQTIEDNCERILEEQDKVILKLDKKIPFLFKLFASIDYAIIPEEAFDKKTLKIKDFYNTTGPYKLESNEDGAVVLNANKEHYFYSAKAPQKIKFDYLGENTLENFNQKKIDIITTDDSTEPDKLIKFAKENDLSLHMTYKINTGAVVFTAKGQKNISRERRLHVGEIIKKSLTDKVNSNDAFEFTSQFFPPLGETSLSENEVKSLEKKFDESKIETGKGLRLYLRESQLSHLKAIIEKLLPDLEISTDESFPDFYDDRESNYDMVLAFTDTGFLEDVSLINYSLNFGYFGGTRDENAKWLEEYNSLLDKKERLKRLKIRHTKALESPTFVSLYTTPYIMISSKDWELNQSQFYSNSKLWLLRKK